MWAKDDTNVRMEVVEIKRNKWFVGVQFHPEYLSKVLNPSRPYLGLVAACAGMLDEISKEELERSQADGGLGGRNGILNGNSLVNGDGHF